MPNNGAWRNGSAGWKRPEKLVIARGGMRNDSAEWKRVTALWCCGTIVGEFPELTHFQEHEKINSVHAVVWHVIVLYS